MAGCGPGEFVPDVGTKDKINLLIKGKFYGHPNAKRAAAQNDTRQCYYHSANSPSDSSYTAPLIIVSSSTDGIIEYQADHFDGQLRGNLIVAKYGGGLKRVILTPDGLGVIPESDPALNVVGDGGLFVTQAPDGSLIEIRYPQNTVFYHKPSEAPITALKVTSVFPRRGGLAGGTKLSVYGVNLSANSAVKVKVQDSYQDCVHIAWRQWHSGYCRDWNCWDIYVQKGISVYKRHPVSREEDSRW